MGGSSQQQRMRARAVRRFDVRTRQRRITYRRMVPYYQQR